MADSAPAVADPLSLLRATLEATADGILVVGIDGRFSAYNQRFCKMWQLPAGIVESGDDEAALAHVLDQLQDPDAFIAKVRELYDHPRDTSFDVLEFQDGRIFERYSRPQLVDGEVAGRVWSFRDVTARRQAEMDRLDLHRQLLQSQKMEAIGQLSGGFAHDFNNILGVVLGYAELAEGNLKHRPDDEMAEFVGKITTAAQRGRQLVARMLDFSRAVPHPEGGRSTVGPVIDETVALLLPSLPATVSLDVAVAPDLPPVPYAAISIQQIVTNLLLNAIHAVGPSGRVQVEASVRTTGGICAACGRRVDGEFVVLTVRDDGCGMTPEVRERIFEPFFSTKSTFGGSGLGLAVTHTILRDLDGHVLVESQAGRGSAFHILLPAAVAVESAVEHESNHHSAMAPEEVTGAHVLVVDDERTLAQITQQMLKSRGHRATIHDDSRAALEAFRADPQAFDLVISDQTMPGLTGRDMLLAMREVRPDIPVILMTGYSAEIDADAAARLGFHYLAKPVTMKTLLDTVQSVL